jgi:hypothetical protein
MNSPMPAARRSWRLRGVLAVLGAYVLLMLGMMWWWDTEPDAFDPLTNAQDYARAHDERVVTGTVTVTTLIRVTDTLLHKRGGYTANDIAPPGVLLDNMPNWEFGVILQVRDLALSLRNDLSRSQSQSIEDVDLREAFNYFSFAHRKWILPSSESQYGNGIEKLDAYLKRLTDDNDGDAQFYARADNLASYLELVSKRLGSLSQRLSASVGQERINTDLAGDPSAEQSTPGEDSGLVKTPWMKVDNVFYEARGTTWALVHILKALEHDFGSVLRDKNALISLRQIVRELEEAQAPMWSPVVLNGGQYGLFANHSLVMANYVSRANAAIIDLRKLLERG